ncbi:MAG: transposase [Hyphomicrobium sp.]|nr:transposase [Hyphomicrobium sp.]
MSEKCSQHEAEGDEPINWAAVAKVLDVPPNTLPPVVSAIRRSVDLADAVPVGRVSLADGYALTDEEWALVEPLIPRGPGAGGKQDRAFLNACLFRQRVKGNGREWASSPEAATIPLKSLQGRFLRWCMNNWWERLAVALETTALSEQRKRDFRGIGAESTNRRARVLALRAS